MTNLLTFAEQHNLTPIQAVVLPALFDKVATEFNLVRNQLISDAILNKELGDYLAGVSRTVAAKVA